MALMSVTDKQRRLGLQPGPASRSNSSSRGQLMMTADRNDLVIDRRERLDLLPLWFNSFNVTPQTSYSSASNFQTLQLLLCPPIRIIADKHQNLPSFRRFYATCHVSGLECGVFVGLLLQDILISPVLKGEQSAKEHGKLGLFYM